MLSSYATLLPHPRPLQSHLHVPFLPFSLNVPPLSLKHTCSSTSTPATPHPHLPFPHTLSLPLLSQHQAHTEIYIPPPAEPDSHGGDANVRPQVITVITLCHISSQGVYVLVCTCSSGVRACWCVCVCVWLCANACFIFLLFFYMSL